ncbi:arylamine N-acetyltransferase [Pantoea sp. 1.19]|uniref:arylamine N-acetyltransferase family protein n=1 Tax=Pantoea sp. 1.19 TaxID=1925589 RepID=UPI000948B7F7|nr:arylamine N-acetyltransferase [Pantoea sp. 1.19]
MTWALPAWLTRIGYDGSPAVNLATLQQLHRCQPDAIPFENLDVLLGRPLDLSDDGIFDKLVTAGRGGYCFELNGLFAAGLRQLGFRVRDLAARVLLGDSDEVPPRSHRMMMVTLDGERWLVDVGFGGQTLTAPLRLMGDVVQPTPHGDFRLRCGPRGWRLESHTASGWLPLYQFTLAAQYPADYRMANHFVASWPASHFRHRLMVARSLRDGSSRRLNNRCLSRVQGSARQTQWLTDAAALADTLSREFGLRLDHPRHGIPAAWLARLLAGLGEDT